MSELVPAATKNEETALSWPMIAAEIVVTDQASFDMAGIRLREAKALLHEIEQDYKPHIDGANKLHKELIATRNGHQAHLLEAEKILKRTIGKYLDAQEAKARQQRAIEEAAAREARETAEKEAQELDDAQEPEMADAVREEAEVQAAPPPEPAAPATKGIVAKEKWTAMVVDEEKFFAGVAAGMIPKAMVKIEQGKLNKQAQALQRELNYPGVKLSVEKIIAAGRK